MKYKRAVSGMVGSHFALGPPSQLGQRRGWQATGQRPPECVPWLQGFLGLRMALASERCPGLQGHAWSNCPLYQDILRASRTQCSARSNQNAQFQRALFEELDKGQTDSYHPVKMEVSINLSNSLGAASRQLPHTLRACHLCLCHLPSATSTDSCCVPATSICGLSGLVSQLPIHRPLTASVPLSMRVL